MNDLLDTYHSSSNPPTTNQPDTLDPLDSATPEIIRNKADKLMREAWVTNMFGIETSEQIYAYKRYREIADYIEKSLEWSAKQDEHPLIPIYIR